MQRLRKVPNNSGTTSANALYKNFNFIICYTNFLSSGAKVSIFFTITNYQLSIINYFLHFVLVFADEYQR
jgi:hypothetical protein